MRGNTDHLDDEGAKKIGRANTMKTADLDTGAALRSVYQKTVDEAVPDEMMDLLGRLD